MVPPSLLVFPPSQMGAPSLKGEAKVALDCAHRATLILLNDSSKLACFSPLEWHLCWSHGGRRASSSPIINGLPSLLVFCSREGILLDLPLRASNEGLLRPRVARAQEINRPPSHSLLREQGISTGVIPPLSSWGLCEQEGHLAAPSPPVRTRPFPRLSPMSSYYDISIIGPGPGPGGGPLAYKLAPSGTV